MGQAKLRGTYDERVKQALTMPARPRRLSARERDQLVNEAVAEYVGKVLFGPPTKRNYEDRQDPVILL